MIANAKMCNQGVFIIVGYLLTKLENHIFVHVLIIIAVIHVNKIIFNHKKMFMPQNCVTEGYIGTIKLLSVLLVCPDMTDSLTSMVTTAFFHVVLTTSLSVEAYFY